MDGSDMTDEEKLADYDRMKSLYNRMLRGVENTPEEGDFFKTLNLVSSGLFQEAMARWPAFIDHINAYRARIQYFKNLLYESHRGYGKCHDVHGISPWRACDPCKEVAAQREVQPTPEWMLELNARVDAMTDEELDSEKQRVRRQINHLESVVEEGRRRGLIK